MVYAYRLLVKKLEEEGMNYPLHLGVTEAGGGEDGRVKSALGIGTLLEDGLGDTIRVSLTEDPEFEIPVAQILANRYNDRSNHSKIESVLINNFDFFNYSKRETYSVENIGNGNVPIVFADYSKIKITDKEDLKQIGYVYNKLTDKWILTDNASDFIYLNDEIKNLELPLSLKKVYDFKVWSKLKDFSKSFPLLNADEYLEHNINSSIKFINVSDDQLNESLVKRLQIDTSAVLVLNTDNLNGMAEQRSTFFKLLNNNIKTPVIIKRSYKNISFDEIRLYSSTDFGSLLIDGFGDGIWLENNNYKKNSLQDINLLQFNILQAARARVTKTEYIACPSCGRTLFDLQKTTEMIRKRTLHLKGVKIAIMGCIVNGPGEMADADYGYVGSGIDKITLYRGKDIVKKNIKSAIAVDELIDLIKEDDIWMEPC